MFNKPQIIFKKSPVTITVFPLFAWMERCTVPTFLDEKEEINSTLFLLPGIVKQDITQAML